MDERVIQTYQSTEGTKQGERGEAKQESQKYLLE